MNSKRYLLQSITLLNLFIVAAAIGFFIYFLNPLLKTPVLVKMPSPKDMSEELPVRKEATLKLPSANHTLIGEQNLFHPDRITPEEKKAPVSLPKPELVLHGTMITSGLKIAHLEDKKAGAKSPGRSAPYIDVKEGDTVSGYTIRQITENMIVLTNGEEQMTLYLDELKDRKGEITGPTRATAPATATQPQMASPPTPQPAQRPSMVQSVPSGPTPPLRQPASQPFSPTVPPEQQRQPAMQQFTPAPLTSVPSPPVMKRP